MTAARRFTVMTTGNVEPGFDSDQVALEFVDLLRTTPETALSFVQSEQCVAADISEDRALAYQKSLRNIGLRVVLIPSSNVSAANDADIESSSDDATTHEPVDVISDATTYTANEAADDSPGNEGEVSLESTEVDLRPDNEAMHKPGNRPVRLALLFLVAVVLVVFIVATRSPETVSVAKSLVAEEQFSQTPRASEDIQTLLDVSGMNIEFSHFTDYIKTAHIEYFSPLLEENTTLTRDSYNEMMSKVPLAFNTNALRDTVGNQLQKTSFEADVLDLIALYESPLVSRFIEQGHERNVSVDPQGFEKFMSQTNDKPLPSDRRSALIGLMDTLGLDTASFDIAGDLHRSLIATAGELRPDRETQAAKDHVREEIKVMRATMSFNKPLVREQVIQGLAWQLETFEVHEIRDLNTTLDRSIARGFIREVTIGYESFLKDSTFWLHRHIDDR